MSSHPRSAFNRWATVILFGLLVLAFGLWGIGDIFRSGTRLTVVAAVGDHEITVEAFDAAVRREAQALQSQANNTLSKDQLISLGVGQRALTPLLQQALIAEFATDMGLVVTDQQLLDAIARERAFQVNGKFDQNLYSQVLRQNGLTEEHYLWLLRSEILRNELFRPAGESVTMPEAETTVLFNYLAEQRIARYVEITDDSITDLPAPTDAELQQAYSDYTADFQAPEYRAVTLLHLTPQDFFHEVTVTEEEAKAQYDANPEAYQVPEQRALRQVVFDTQAEADAALAEAQAGKSLDEIASEKRTTVASLALQSKKQLGAVLPELAEAAFALPEGQTLGVAKTILGYHLFEITQIEPQVERSFDEVRGGIEDAIRLQRAKEIMASVAKQIDDEMATGATLEETAEKLQITLRTIDTLDSDGLDRAGQPVEGLPSPAQVLPQIFQADAGVDQLLNQAPDGSYYAFRVDSITPPTARPFDEVKDKVVALWERLTRGKLAQEKAEALAQQINDGGTTLDQIAEQQGLTVSTTNPMVRYDSDPNVTPSSALPPALFGVAVGGAVTAASDNGVLVAVLSEIRAADRGADEQRFGVLQQRLDGNLTDDVLDETLRSLSDVYPVEINQQAIQQVLANF